MADMNPALEEDRVPLELEIGGIVIGLRRHRIGSQPGQFIIGDALKSRGGLVHGANPVVAVTPTV
jgi:hypothetical protein